MTTSRQLTTWYTLQMLIQFTMEYIMYFWCMYGVMLAYMTRAPVNMYVSSKVPFLALCHYFVVTVSKLFVCPTHHRGR